MYEHEYESMYRLEESYWWFVARRALAVDLLNREIRSRAAPYILDIGCGTGANLKAFSHLATAIGIDCSMDALHFCRRRGLETMALSPVEELPFNCGTFDIVTALDVFEHMDDDLRGLREVHRVTKTHGLVL